jgi:hypothetical protein
MSRESIGAMFTRALKCETREQADAWMQVEIADFEQLYGYTTEVARQTILQNLGYMTGYYDRGVAEKIFLLFGAEHPIFGKPDQWPKNTQEVFDLGAMAQRLTGDHDA